MRRPNGWLAALAGAGLLALLLACVLVFPTMLYPPLSPAELQGVGSARERIELQDARGQLQHETRELLLQGIGGLVIVVGAVATLLQVQVNREGQITDRFTHAIDQLGSDKLDVRLGGIYALERIADNSARDRETITKILGAFVRGHSPWSVGSPGGPEHPTPTVDLALPWLTYRVPDVSAAVNVLGRRKGPDDKPQLYLSRVDLRTSQLAGSRLPNTLLRHANLARSSLSGIDLSRSDLTNADLRRCYLQHAHLAGATLRGAHLEGADLRGADLRGADLRGANLRDARLQGADLGGVRHDAETTWPGGEIPASAALSTP